MARPFGAHAAKHQRAVYGMLRQGYTQREVAEVLGIWRGTVQYLVARLQRERGVYGKAEPDDASGERCRCGLRVDKDHQPATCDMLARAHALVTGRAGHWTDVHGDPLADEGRAPAVRAPLTQVGRAGR